MVLPDYARITGKTVQHVELETERRQNEDDVQDVQEIENAMVIHFTDGSSLRIALGGEGELWQRLDYDFTPAPTVEKKP
jgi:cyanophycinase-like exopeptidase